MIKLKNIVEGFLEKHERSKNPEIQAIYKLHDRLEKHPAYYGSAWSPTYAKQFINISRQATRMAEAFYKKEKSGGRPYAARIKNKFYLLRYSTSDLEDHIYGEQSEFILYADGVLQYLHDILDVFSETTK
jgi:hypothetical protein